MKAKSRCRCCGDTVPDLSKRFDSTLGFICTECHAFLVAIGPDLWHAGWGAATCNPQRNPQRNEEGVES